MHHRKGVDEVSGKGSPVSCLLSKKCRRLALIGRKVLARGMRRPQDKAVQECIRPEDFMKQFSKLWKEPCCFFGTFLGSDENMILFDLKTALNQRVLANCFIGKVLANLSSNLWVSCGQALDKVWANFDNVRANIYQILAL